jgi:hypothetical protein
LTLWAAANIRIERLHGTAAVSSTRADYGCTN